MSARVTEPNELTERTSWQRGLVRAELLKLRATRSTWVLVVVAVTFCALWTVVTVLTMDGPTNTTLTTDERVQNVYQNAQQGYLFALILGVLGITGEHRHQTITWSFLATPRRGRVLAAKLVGYGLVAGLLLALACVAVTVVVGATALAVRGEQVTAPGVPLVLLGSVLSTTLYTVLGVALGALIRSQVAAIAVAFAWFYYAEFLLVWFLPDVGQWVPSGAAKALSGWHLDGGALLPAWAGGLLFVAYATVLAGAAQVFTSRRDVT